MERQLKFKRTMSYTITKIPSFRVGTSSILLKVSSPLVTLPNIAYWRYITVKNGHYFECSGLKYIQLEIYGEEHSSLPDHQDEEHLRGVLRMMTVHCLDPNICNQNKVDFIKIILHKSIYVFIYFNALIIY